MIVKSLKLKNFKKFESEYFQFNSDVNIFVGDNNAGKSTLLEALDIVLNFSYRGRTFSSEFAPDLFNLKVVNQYLATDKTSKNLPELLIEAFVEGIPEYRGINNSRDEDSQGISLKASFDTELEAVFEEYLKSGEVITSIPIEFYKVEWLDFAWNPIKAISRPYRSLYVDPTKIHPTIGKNQYISNILNTTLERKELAKLVLNYRENLQRFNQSQKVRDINSQLDSDNLITEKNLTIAANTIPTGAIQAGLQLEVDNVGFHLIGKGEQSQVQIKLAIQNKSKSIDLLMMEEPENHLSHTSLNKLVHYIDCQRDSKQLFISTHSSFVLNKLSIDRICLMRHNYKRLHELDGQVVKTLKRLPGYDTLRVALADKIVLVEGPSDELILKKIYQLRHGCLPENVGIDIVVVRGVGFKTFIEIGKEIGTQINVLRDNDGDFDENVSGIIENYKKYSNIKIISASDDSDFSIEPALINANAKSIEDIDNFARIVLSAMTLNKYTQIDDLNGKKEFLLNWFKSEPGNGKGKKKVDSAIKIFETDEAFKFPEFLVEVMTFG